ncbi:MAG: proton-conducting transporter membrane subunit [Campylobacterota bacterium]|nr:proton-conducting transporter membrane subunit [Campylobacterota bacterium]
MRYIPFVISLFILWVVTSLFDTSLSWQYDLSRVGLDEVVIGLRATALANFFALLIAFSIMILSIATPKYRQTKSFYLLFYLLSAGLFLIVYAEDYLLFFVGWEVMSVTTYLLLSYDLSRKALLKYVIFAMASAMSLLAGIMILYSTSHSFLYADAHQAFLLLSDNMRTIFIILMLFAFFVKLGTIGFHYWLVDSYDESADLFTPFLSAVLSKMGIYAMIILLIYVVDISTLSHHWLGYTLGVMGLLSSIIAAFKALNEDSMKRALAYSSIAQLGYIVTVLSLADGVSAALYHSLIHTLVKLMLFINIAGIIYVTARSKYSQLGGLIYRMPQSFVLLLIGIIVLAGMPPLGGFASKFLMYTTLLEGKNLLMLAAMMFAGASAFLYIYKMIYGIYLGHPTSKSLESVAEVPFIFLLPQYIISLILIVMGVFPGLIVPYLNTILVELGVEQLPFAAYETLGTAIASYNGLVVMSAFMILFIIVLSLLLSLSSKVKEAKDRFDIAYCGEVPNEGTHLHYGYSMGRELKRVWFVAIILKNSSSFFYDYIAKQLWATSEFVRRIYSGNLVQNFNIAVVFALILLWWGIK